MAGRPSREEIGVPGDPLGAIDVIAVWPPAA